MSIPHGLIFAIFMVACMIGACLFKQIGSSMPAPQLLTYVVMLSAGGLLPAAMGSRSLAINLLGFCLFEGCVGCYWPLIGNIRSELIPEEARSTIMNMFRIPLNLIVVAVLYHIGDLEQQTVFQFCVLLLSVSCTLASMLPSNVKSSQPKEMKSAAASEP